MDRTVFDAPEYENPKELCNKCPITDCDKPCARYTKLAIEIFEYTDIHKLLELNAPHRKVKTAAASIVGRGFRNEPIYEYDGEYHNLPEWSRVVGIPYSTLLARIRSGWSFKRVIEIPKGKPRRTFNNKQEAK